MRQPMCHWTTNVHFMDLINLILRRPTAANKVINEST